MRNNVGYIEKWLHYGEITLIVMTTSLFIFATIRAVSTAKLDAKTSTYTIYSHHEELFRNIVAYSFLSIFIVMGALNFWLIYETKIRSKIHGEE